MPSASSARSRLVQALLTVLATLVILQPPCAANGPAAGPTAPEPHRLISTDSPPSQADLQNLIAQGQQAQAAAQILDSLERLPEKPATPEDAKQWLYYAGVLSYAGHPTESLSLLAKVRQRIGAAKDNDDDNESDWEPLLPDVYDIDFRAHETLGNHAEALNSALLASYARHGRSLEDFHELKMLRSKFNVMLAFEGLRELDSAADVAESVAPEVRRFASNQERDRIRLALYSALQLAGRFQTLTDVWTKYDSPLSAWSDMTLQYNILIDVANAYGAQGSYPEAESTLQWCLGLFNSSDLDDQKRSLKFQTRVVLVNLLLAEKQYIRARLTLDDMAGPAKDEPSQDPAQSVQVALLRARLAAQTSDSGKALEYLDLALQLADQAGPTVLDPLTVRFAVIDAANDANGFTKAEALVKQISLARLPASNPWPVFLWHIQMGRALLGEGKAADAEREFDQAVPLAASQPNVRFLLSKLALLKYHALKAQGKQQAATSFAASLRGKLSFSSDQLTEFDPPPQPSHSDNASPPGADAAAIPYLTLSRPACASAYCRARQAAQDACHEPKYTDLQTEVTRIEDLADNHHGEGVESALTADIECAGTHNVDRATLLAELSSFYWSAGLRNLARNLRQDAWDSLPAISPSTATIRQSLADDLAADADSPQAKVLWSTRAAEASDLTHGVTSFDSTKIRLSLLNTSTAPYIDINALCSSVATSIGSAGLKDTMHLYSRLSDFSPHTVPELRKCHQSLTDTVRDHLETLAARGLELTSADDLREVLRAQTTVRHLYTLSPVAFEKMTLLAVPSPASAGSLSPKQLHAVSLVLKYTLQTAMRNGNSALTLRIWSQMAGIATLLKKTDQSTLASDQLNAAQAYADTGHFPEALQLLSGSEANAASKSDIDAVLSRIVLQAMRQALTGSADKALAELKESDVVLVKLARHGPDTSLRLTLAREAIASCSSAPDNTGIESAAIESLRGIDSPSRIPSESILAAVNVLFERGDLSGARKVVDAVLGWEAAHGLRDGNSTIGGIAEIASNFDRVAAISTGLYQADDANAYQVMENNGSLLENLNAQDVKERSEMEPFQLWRAYLALKRGDFAAARDRYAALVQQLTTNSLTRTYFDGPTMAALVGILFANANDVSDAGYFLQAAQQNPNRLRGGMISDIREDLLASLEGLILQLRGKVPDAVRRLAKLEDGKSVIYGRQEFVRDTFKAEDLLGFVLPPGRPVVTELRVAELSKLRRTLLVDAADRLITTNNPAADDATREAFVALQYLAAAHSIESTTFGSGGHDDANDDFLHFDLDQARAIQANEWTARRLFAKPETDLRLQLEPLPSGCAAIAAAIPDYTSWMRHTLVHESPGEITGIATRQAPGTEAPTRQAEEEPKLPRSTAELSKMMNEARQRVESLAPTPATLVEVQARLKSDDALIVYYTADRYTYAMWVTQDRLRLHRISKTRDQLDEAVRRILLSATAESDSQEVTFLTQSNALYKEILGPFEDDLQRVRHLTVTGTGPLMRIPFALLVSKPYSGHERGLQALRDAEWLNQHVQVRRLVALSHQAASLDRPEIAAEGKGPALVGFSEPDLPDSSQCQANATQPPGSRPKVMLCKIDGAVDFIPTVAATANAAVGLSDPTCIATLDFSGRASVCISGPTFTQEAVHRIGPRLDGGSVVVFASHGLLSQQTAELNGAFEPAIVTSANAAHGDGIMTVSEVSGLKFPAGLVILTACNSSTPDSGEVDDTDSGLVQAFMFAGTRQVIVTHWPVLADPAQLVTSQTVEAIFKNKAPAATALNDAMTAVRNMAGIRRPDQYLQPLYWAGFSLVDKYL